MNPTPPFQPKPVAIDPAALRPNDVRPVDRGSAWASYFVSVIVHINVLLILAMSFRALQKEEPAVLLDTTFSTGEEEELTRAEDAKDDVVPVENVVFAEAAPQRAEDMVRVERPVDLPGLKGLGGNLGIGGGSGGGGVGFFGTSARGRSFVFVVDCSGSMQGARFRRAVEELQKSLKQLEPDQKFQIVFFNDQAVPFVHSTHRTKLLPATPSVLEDATAWIGQRRAQGGTIPDDALTRALALQPDVVFFLTDADSVPRKVRTLIAEKNRHNSTVHTIAFGHRGGETLMQGIAADHRGRYRFVP